MTKNTSSDKYLNRVLIGIGVSLALMVAMFHFFGELQGLFCVVIALLIQISFLTARVVALEQELRISREAHEPPKMSEETVQL